MKCRCCDVRLTSFESTRKYTDGVYTDMCNVCFKASGYKGVVIERNDLRKEEDVYDWWDDPEEEE